MDTALMADLSNLIASTVISAFGYAVIHRFASMLAGVRRET